MRRAAFLLAGVVLAGCLAGPPDLETLSLEVEAAALELLVQDHDHFGPGHGGSRNVELVGYHNGVDDSADPNAVATGVWYTELAVHGDLVFMVRSGAAGGFSIINVANPGSPRFVGSYEALPGADIEVSDDGRWAFFASQRNMPAEMAAALGAAHPGAVAARGISVVDLADPHNPGLAAFLPLPINGPHTITYHRHSDGRAYLLACTYDLVTGADGSVTGTVPVTQRVLVLRVEEQDVTGIPVALNPVATYQLLESAPAGRLYMPHDTSVQFHPGTGQTLVYVAYWDKGVRILDWSDSAELRDVGAWNDFGPSSRGNIHLARPFDRPVAGRHVTVAEPEIIAAEETGYVAFLDTSDPAEPSTLGRWTLPGELIVQAFEFSPHNFDTWDGRVALAHNHAGLWVLGVGTAADLAEPKSLGFYLPDMPRVDSPRPQPYFWGVVERDGLLYAVDEATGLHVLRYTGP